MDYKTPEIVDFGSIADHTFTNDADNICIVLPEQAVGPKGKGVAPVMDCFNEPSHS